jgi:hypothetical protein
MKEQRDVKRPRALWWIAAVAVVLAAVVSLVAFWGKDGLRTLVRHSPYRYDDSFHRTVARADRIVVRTGGFDCCGSVKNDSILFSVTDPKMVAEVAAHIRFEPVTIANSFDESCLCCGYPGIDWYRGTERIALTAMQHGRGIRWKGFTTARFLGLAMGYGDLPLSRESRDWLKNWLEAHGVSTKDKAPTIIN